MPALKARAESHVDTCGAGHIRHGCHAGDNRATVRTNQSQLHTAAWATLTHRMLDRRRLCVHFLYIKFRNKPWRLVSLGERGGERLGRARGVSRGVDFTSKFTLSVSKSSFSENLTAAMVRTSLY
jgi:hypothetical protein